MPENVSAPDGRPESAQTNVNAASSQTQAADPYHGKSREQIISELESMSREHGELKENYRIVHDFASRVKFLFKQEGDSVTLDKDALKMTAQSQGWLDEWTSEAGRGDMDPNESTAPVGDYPMDETEAAAIDQRVQNLASKIAREMIERELEPFQKERAKSMVAKMADKYPDFNERKTRVLDWAQRNNYPLNDMKRLEAAYYASKGEEGKLMDVGQHEANMAQLEKVMQHSMHPSARSQVANPEASVDELLGMKTSRGPSFDENKQAAMKELGLGGALPPPPS